MRPKPGGGVIRRKRTRLLLMARSIRQAAPILHRDPKAGSTVKADATLGRSILGGTGKFSRAKGTVLTTHLSDRTWQHSLRMQQVALWLSGAGWPAAGFMDSWPCCRCTAEPIADQANTQDRAVWDILTRDRLASPFPDTDKKSAPRLRVSWVQGSFQVNLRQARG